MGAGVDGSGSMVEGLPSVQALPLPHVYAVEQGGSSSVVHCEEGGEKLPKLTGGVLAGELPLDSVEVGALVVEGTDPIGSLPTLVKPSRSSTGDKGGCRNPSVGYGLTAPFANSELCTSSLTIRPQKMASATQGKGDGDGQDGTRTATRDFAQPLSATGEFTQPAVPPIRADREANPILCPTSSPRAASEPTVCTFRSFDRR
ncbi:hypothetical protein Dimus_005590 [Dionaea muscipula]